VSLHTAGFDSRTRVFFDLPGVFAEFETDLRRERRSPRHSTAGSPCRIIVPSSNLTSTQPAPVVRLHPETKQRHLNVLSWG
jgi:hypothetical protein